MKPTAIPDNQVCSECGLDWVIHPENPRRRDCIDLLRDELSIERMRRQHNPYFAYTSPTVVDQNTWTYNASDNVFPITPSGGTIQTTVSGSGFKSIDDPEDPDMGVPAEVSA